MREPRGDEHWLGLRGLTPADAKAIARRRGPDDGSVKAFVSWLQRIDHTGEFYKSDLFELYGMGCELAGEDPETCEKWFKRDMKQAGCTTGKDDKRVNGRGARRVTIKVPSVPSKATSATPLPTTTTPLPKANSKPIAKHLEYLAAA